MSDYYLDDAAAAALWPMRGAAVERLGLLYDDGYLRHTPTYSQESSKKAKGSFRIPSGTLRGVFHNHPKDQYGRLSVTDTEQAKHLGVPSFVMTARDKVLRYDPSSQKTEEVLHQIPLDEIRKRYLIEALAK